MKFLIVGYGSIGKRHAMNARHLGHDVILLRRKESLPNPDGHPEYHSFTEVLKAKEQIDGMIICSPTSEHEQAVERAVLHDIPFLSEKPLAGDLPATIRIRDMLYKHAFKKYDIAFNLRHYPVLKFIKDYLPQLGRVYSARVIAGYYLPYWRPDTDYRKSSSARRDLDGGVHKELVHEIDYILWMLGIPDHVFGHIGKVSHLDIETEDICCGILTYDSGTVVELHLDYLCHRYRRGLQIVSASGTLAWEFSEKQVTFHTEGRQLPEILFALDEGYDFNDTYRTEMRHFVDIIKQDAMPTVSVGEAVAAATVLDAIIASSEGKKMIDL